MKNQCRFLRLKMLTVLLVISVVFPFQSQGTEMDAPRSDGNFLLKMCSAEVGWLDGDKTVDSADALFCLGYVAGFEAGHDLAVFENQRRNTNSNARLIFCAAKRQITAAQKARVLTKFLHDNPQLLDSPMELLTQVAFMQAFPCKE